MSLPLSRRGTLASPSDSTALDPRYLTPSLGTLPATIASFDAEDLTNITNGARVPRWHDRTGRGMDVINTGANGQPVVDIDAAGRRSVNFTGSQYLVSTGFGNSGWGQPSGYNQPLTIATVFKASSAAVTGLRCIVGGASQISSTGATALGLDNSYRKPQLLGGNGTAGVFGASGGPALNDDQWHVVVAVFDTTRGYIMVDGYIVAATTTQAQGSSGLSKLAIGAYADGTNPVQGCRVRRVDIFNSALSPQQAALWSAQMAKRWNLGTVPPQINDVYFDVTDAGSQSVRIFTPPNLGASAPVAIFNHPQGGTYNVAQSYFIYTAIRALASRGFVCTYSNNHGADSWSNDSALTDVANARAYVNGNIATVTGSLLVGASMGGCLASIAASAGTLPDLKGVYLIDPAVNLQWMYANGYSSSINTGFGISAASSIPAGKDPCTLTGAQLPTGMRWRAVASTADSTVSKTNNIDVFAPIIQASNPAEFATVLHPDGHIGTGSSLPADIDAFAQRCGFSGLVK